MEYYEHDVRNGFEPFQPPSGGVKGWFISSYFVFGDYSGDVVTQSNIQEIKNRLEVDGRLIPSVWIENDDALHELLEDKDCKLFIAKYAYGSEEIVFNMPLIAETDESLYEDLLSVTDYPCLNEDVLHEVEAMRIGESWDDYAKTDVLSLIYGELRLEDVLYYDDWEYKVEAEFSDSYLLKVFLEDYGYEYIQHETGTSTYWRLEDRNKLTPPVTRVLELLRHIR